MEAYPLDYTAHNLPLVVLSGLCPTPEGADDLITSRGPLVKAQLPLVQSERREQILQEFLSAEGSDQQWSSRLSRTKTGQTQLVGYKFRAVGRVC
jgi:solute carrier family 25 protein 38